MSQATLEHVVPARSCTTDLRALVAANHVRKRATQNGRRRHGGPGVAFFLPEAMLEIRRRPCWVTEAAAEASRPLRDSFPFARARERPSSA
jgi:hypothetical protein